MVSLSGCRSQPRVVDNWFSLRVLCGALITTMFVPGCAASVAPETSPEQEVEDQFVDPHYIAPVAIDFDFYDWSFEPILAPDGKTLIVFHVEEKEVNNRGQFGIAPVAKSVTIAELNSTDRQTTLEVPGGGALSGVHLTDDGALAFLPGLNPYQIHILDLKNHAFTETVGVLSGTVYSPDGTWMLGYNRTSAPDGLPTLTPTLQSVSGSLPPRDFSDISSHSFAFSADNTRLFLAGEKTTTREKGLLIASPDRTVEPIWIPTKSGSEQNVGLHIHAISEPGNVVLLYRYQAGGRHTYSLINTNISREQPVYELQWVESAGNLSQEEGDSLGALRQFFQGEHLIGTGALFSHDERFFFATEYGRQVFSAESGELLGVNDPDYMSTAGIQGKPIYFPHLRETFNVDFWAGEIRTVNWESQTLGPPLPLHAQSINPLASRVVQAERFILLTLDNLDEYGEPRAGEPNTVRVLTLDLPPELRTTG